MIVSPSPLDCGHRTIEGGSRGGGVQSTLSYSVEGNEGRSNSRCFLVVIRGIENASCVVRLLTKQPRTLAASIIIPDLLIRTTTHPSIKSDA